MRPLRKIAALAVILVGIFSFNTAEDNLNQTQLDLANIDVLDVLNTHRFECRPSGDYLFYVDTDLVKKIRGAKKVNSKIYILERATGKKALLAQNEVQIANFDDSIQITDGVTESEQTFALTNGDVVYNNNTNAPYSFKDLMKYERIYGSYIAATNELLELDRSVLQ